MTSATVTVSNELGLHARPAALFVQLASRFRSHITVCKSGVEVNGKSIMGVMMLAAERAAAREIIADGAEAEPAGEARRSHGEGGFKV